MKLTVRVRLVLPRANTKSKSKGGVFASTPEMLVYYAADQQVTSVLPLTLEAAMNPNHVYTLITRAEVRPDLLSVLPSLLQAI